MTVYRTCQGCKLVEVCDLRRNLKDRLKGLGVTTIKHRCTNRQPEFLPGDQVIVKTGVKGEIEYGIGWFPANYPGIFISEAKNSAHVICFIRPGTESIDGLDEFEPMEGNKGYVKVPRSRVRKGEGEPVKLEKCPNCRDFATLTGECGLDPQYREYADVCALAKQRATA